MIALGKGILHTREGSDEMMARKPTDQHVILLTRLYQGYLPIRLYIANDALTLQE